MSGIPSRPAPGAPPRRLALMITAFSSLGPFAIDTYLPSFPSIERTFGVSSVATQQTLTAYLVPFALMTLWHGAISDTLGRKRVVVAGTLLFALGSVICALAPTLLVLLLGRVLQGMSAGAGMVVGRAIIRDVCAGAQAQRMMAVITMTFAVAPAVAPIVGGWLEVLMGWRAVFVFLTLVALLVAGWCQWSMPETLPPARRRRFTPGLLLRGYAMVLANRTFTAVGLAMTMIFGGMLIYVLAAPKFLIGHLGLSATEFYWLYGPNTLAMMAGAALSGRMAGRLNRRRTLRLGFRAMLAFALGNVLLNLLVAPRVPWCILPIAGYVLAMGVALPTLALMGLDLFPRRRGLASSCQAFLQSSGNAMVSALLVPLIWHSPLTLAAGMAGMLLGGALLIALALFWLRRGGRACRLAYFGR